MTGRDQFANADLVTDIGEDLTQTLPVATIGCRCDAKNFHRRVMLGHPVNDAPVAIGNSVMRFIDHEQVECRHRIKVRRATQCLCHGESRLSGP